MACRVEAKMGDVLLRVAGPDRLQHAHRDHVLRARKSLAHPHRSLELAVEILRFPQLATGHVGFDDQRRVVDQRAWHEAALERRGIDERFEARSRLAPGLRDVIEFVQVEVESSNQHAHRAVFSVGGDKGSFNLRQLADLPADFRAARQADHRAGNDAPRRLRLRVERTCRELQALALNRDLLAAGNHRPHGLGRRFEHDCGQQVGAVDRLEQRIFDPLLALAGVRIVDGRKFDECFRAAVAIAMVVVEHLRPQRVVGDVLLAAHDRCVDIQAAGVRLLIEHIEHQLAHEFGGKFRMHAARCAIGHGRCG